MVAFIWWWMGANKTQVYPKIQTKTLFKKEFCNGFSAKRLMVNDDDVCNGNL